MTVFLYSRPGCHLCDRARDVLEAAGIAFEEVDISTDPALEAEYGILIPVVEQEGRQLFEAGMDPSELPALLHG
ncbi:MAG TPA: glutaredoxin family protein [Actinomycetota bacterium]